jgi:hypothetical protein
MVRAQKQRRCRNFRAAATIFAGAVAKFSLAALSIAFVGAFSAGCGGSSTTTSVGGGSTPTATPIAVSVTPTTATVVVGKTQTFSATVSNDSANKGVTWALSCATANGCGSLSATTSASGTAVTYTAPATAPNPATVTITATSVSDSTKSASATIAIGSGSAPPPPPSAGVSVTLSQTAATVAVNATTTFTATVTGDPSNQGVTWTLAGSECGGPSCGTLSSAASASGTPIVYTAPGTAPSPASVTLTATSVADTTKSASATINIVTATAGGISVTITPKAGGFVVGQVATLTATVSNDPSGAGVTWTASSGTVTPVTATTATFTAPNSAGSGIVVTATSKADTTESASATYGITDLAGVTTYHNDGDRDGVNDQEYVLTTSNVASGTFGKLFSCNADGAIYAQPLWVPNVNIGGGVHNVIVAATMRDSVFVYDADASPCVTYWQQTLIPAGETYGNWNDVGNNDIYPDIGILGTPVIDPSTSNIFVVTKTKTNATTYHQRIHALSIATGAEVSGGPFEITASNVTAVGGCEGGSTMAFDPLWENQRPGLALVNGVVYVAWASHGDTAVWHGWVVGFNTSNLSISSIWNDTLNAVSGEIGCRGGIWMSGGAPAIDKDNNLYVLTGNGAFDGTGSFGDSFVKLSTPVLGVMDYFTPFNENAMQAVDADLGSSGTSVLFDQTTGPSYMVGGSKNQVIYVVDRTNMGHKGTTTDPIVQEWTADGRSFSTPAFWNNTLYYFGIQFHTGHPGESFPFDTSTGMFATTPSASTPSMFRFNGASPSVSASSATTNGILWALETGDHGTDGQPAAPPAAPYPPAGPAVLHAFDATNIATELWNSSMNASDAAGNAVKFTVPTIANGKVYVPTRGNDDTLGNGTVFGEVDVYGLIP